MVAAQRLTLNEAQRAIGFLRLGERAMDYGNGNQSLRRVELDRAEAAWRPRRRRGVVPDSGMGRTLLGP